jgi:hypothetical protein
MTRLRNILPVVIAVTLGTCISSASAATKVIPGCDNPLDSALNQYCDAIPTPVGKQPPQPGIPALSTALPGRTVAKVSQLQNPQQLLNLPAAAGPVHATLRFTKSGGNGATGVAATAGPTGGWSLPWWLFLIMAVLAVALAAAAYARWQRARPQA